MSHQAMDATFETHNQAEEATTAIQTRGEAGTGQGAGPALPAPAPNVARTVAVVILTTVLMLGALYLLWEARSIIGWCVGGCVIAAALDPAVNRLQQFHLKRSTAVVLVYVTLVVVGLGLVALCLPPLVDQIGGLTAYGLELIRHPGQEGVLFESLANRLGLTPYLPKLTDWLQSLSGELSVVAGGFLSYTSGVIGTVADVVSMLFIAFYLLLDGERVIGGLLELIPETQRSRVRRLLSQSADAVSGYIMGNVLISVICGVAVFLVLVALRMPYAGPLALMVAIFDLIPQVGATLGGVALAIAGLFVSPFNSLVLAIYFIIYQQVENYLLTPLVYSHRAQLHPLTIFIAVVLGGIWLGVPGALLAIPAAEIIRSIAVEWLDSRAKPATPPRLEPDRDLT